MDPQPPVNYPEYPSPPQPPALRAGRIWRAPSASDPPYGGPGGFRFGTPSVFGGPPPMYPGSYDPYQGYPSQQTNGLAVASLVTSIAGVVLGIPLAIFCYIGWVIPVVGAVMGGIALNQIKQTRPAGPWAGDRRDRDRRRHGGATRVGDGHRRGRGVPFADVRIA